MSLPADFTARPFAHRGYHDRSAGRIENSIAAAEAAIARGYGIECDVQLTADGEAVVFHDYALERLTGQKGFVRMKGLAELEAIKLKGSDQAIPSLSTFLQVVGGKVPLLIEIKDQDGKMGPNVGPLEAAVVRDLKSYTGPVALMSFNPHSMAEMARLLPDVPRGLTTSAYLEKDWPYLPAETRKTLRGIPDYERVGASFISHEVKDLGRKRVAELKRGGAVVLCWTVRSAAVEAEARKIADTITFEAYPAEVTA